MWHRSLGQWAAEGVDPSAGWVLGVSRLGERLGEDLHGAGIDGQAGVMASW